jgi:2,3-bisphosphoglycerate-independent phosphoglycerate mutase
MHFKNVNVVYEKDNLINTHVKCCHPMLEQLRIAKPKNTPIYLLFSPWTRADFEAKAGYSSPSPKVATYDLQPEMSAFPVSMPLWGT